MFYSSLVNYLRSPYSAFYASLIIVLPIVKYILQSGFSQHHSFELLHNRPPLPQILTLGEAFTVCLYFVGLRYGVQ